MMMFQAQPDIDERPKKKKKSERPSSSGMLFFIIAFIGCLLVFAGIGAIWWHVASPDIPFLGGTQTTTTTAPTSVSSRFSTADRFSVAVYITDNSGALQTVELALFKPDTDNATAIGLPAELGLPDADNDTLARRFATGGAESAQMALSAYLGKNVDYYVVLSYKAVEDYFTALGGNLIVKLDKNVDQQSEDGSFSIHLTAGEQALSPKQVANLLRCDNWQGGRRERADMHAVILSAYINQFITEDRTLSADHASLMTVANSNLNSERFGIIEPPLSYLADLNGGAICTAAGIEGSFEGAGDYLRFAPSASVVDMITGAMK